MQVQQIVRASADVLTVTHLAPGDVYKRVDDGAYSGTPVLRFGIVTDVMNNGEDAAVTALEYVADYTDGIKVHSVVMNGSKPLAIFPAQPAEVEHHFVELQASADTAVRRAEEALAKARDAAQRVDDARTRALTEGLTAPHTSDGTVEGVLVGPAAADAEESA